MCGRVDNAPPLGERPALNLQACHCGTTSIGKPFMLEGTAMPTPLAGAAL
jgi:hypothetical protein